VRKIVVAIASLGLIAGFATPAQAVQSSTKSYSNCDQLLKKYPNGVAKSKSAAAKAVKSGNARPKISASLYKTNGKRLDRDKDGVMCEQVGRGSGGRGIWKPTGYTAIDLVADDLVSTKLQNRYMIAFLTSLLEQIEGGDSPCANWVNELFRIGYLGTFVPQSAEVSGVGVT